MFNPTIQEVSIHMTEALFWFSLGFLLEQFTSGRLSGDGA